MRLGHAYAAVVALVVAQIAYFYGRLPDVVASHFARDGLANAYMPRASFVAFYAGLVVFLLLVFGAVSFLVSVIPTELINVPNKEHWFTDERAATSRAWLGRELRGMGLVTVVFLVVVMQRVFMANVEGTRPCLPTSYVLVCIGGLVVALGAMAVRLMRRFS
jgi:uncharacterized membrane protein